MKRLLKRLMFVSFSLMFLVSLSGCAKVINTDTKKVYPLNFEDWPVWDGFFVRPIAEIMNWISQNTGSFALGIVLTTIIVRTVFWPVYTKSNETSIKMQALQPEMKKIQEKYAGKSDPESRNKLNFELMSLYKEHNVNPLTGCIPPLLQMPVFLAMYNAVVKLPHTGGREGYMRFSGLNLDFLWLNLSDRDPYYILPILVALTSIIMQFVSMYGLSEEAKNNPTMKMMMWVMPAMMLVFSVTQAAALSFYWIVGNIYSTLQILIVKKPFKKQV